MSDNDLAHAERVILGACLAGESEKVWSFGVAPDMFDPRVRMPLAAVMHEMFINGEKVELGTVQSRLMENSSLGACLPELIDASQTFWPGMAIEPFAKVIRDDAERRALRAALTRGLQMLDTDLDPEDVKGKVTDAISLAPSEAKMETYTLDDVLTMEPLQERWVVPGVLAHRDRLMITANEGAGKSVLLSQIALGAAWGAHPFTTGEAPFDPKRVLVLDVENDHESQLSRVWSTVNTAYKVMMKDTPVEPDIRLFKVKDIDLLNGNEAAEFIRTCVFHMPDLVVMGSLYKMASSGEEHERFARAVMRVVDTVRARTGAAFLIEAHAGHGFQGNRNGGRVDGSSLWLRWPELGMWMKGWKPIDDNPRRVHVFQRWRGDRVRRTAIPYAIEMGGGGLPFVGIERSEYEVRYGE